MRFPDKNLALFRGIPLAALAMEHAFGAPAVDRVILASDSPEILALAKPPAIALKQPASISGPDAGSTAAARWGLRNYPSYSWLVLLQPTSPLRTPADIEACLHHANFYGARTVTPAGQPSGHVYLIRSDLLLSGWSLNEPHLATVTVPDERCVDVDYEYDLKTAHERATAH